MVIVICVCTSCAKQSNGGRVEGKLFTTISEKHSSISFRNVIHESENFNYYNYIYSYASGGVAAADFNNDQLVDLFFTSGTGNNKLYINQGNFIFKDLTKTANIVKKEGFDMGVSIVDINSDGYLDIYINRGGWFKEEALFSNLLYVNNGDLTFTECAKAYGLADTNRGVASVFFDYDNDGDLDLYVANNPNINSRETKNVLSLLELQKDPKTALRKGSDKLYNNNGEGYFTDVSLKAGIMPDLGFGLNPQVGDLNNDGYLDLFVSNDFKMPDFAYVNNGDGTFRESRNTMFKHLSFYSMGSDIADVNNDGLDDLIVLDMNPEDYIRSKTTMTMIPRARFSEMVQKNYHYQYMHNVLQINNGNETFSEVGYMAGIANTDWSWAPLLADFDLDGHKDIFISNGIYRDVLDKDVNAKIRKLVRTKGRIPTSKELFRYTQLLPQQKMSNYFFKNNHNLTFSNTTQIWADFAPTFSNGATYADFDNDGDLDVVVNNINEAPTILKNNTVETNKGNFLKIQFLGTKQNRKGVGTRVNLYFEDAQIQTLQLINSRGYLSSVSNTLHFGLGANNTIPAVEIVWPDKKTQMLFDVEANQLLTINYIDASENNALPELKPTLFEKILSYYAHTEIPFDDYKVQLLLPHKLSQLGPAIAKSDVNKDGIEDVFLGGAHQQKSQLLLGNSAGGFSNKVLEGFHTDKQYEDIGACFFDADNDGDDDLYVISGSYEFLHQKSLLQDRLYKNDGHGNYTKCRDCLPKIYHSGSVVVAADYDADGDIDLFVGGRSLPGKYPLPATSSLLINNNGKFVEKTNMLATGLSKIGMITDAQWDDLDLDGDTDLIVTGEWMGIVVFENHSGKLIRSNSYNTLNETTGWWNKILIDDVDGDGDKDIIAGNLGLNYKYQATRENPFHMYSHDFDNNGIEDVVLAKNYKTTQVPIRGKSCTAQQMPYLKEKIKTYNEFALADMNSIFGNKMKSAIHYTATEFRSGIFMQQPDKHYKFSSFHLEAQKSPVNGILFEDLDADGIKDIVLAGNNHQSEIETTRADAGIGVFLKGQGDGKFVFVPNKTTGFYADKDVRHLLSLKSKEGKLIFVANNNAVHDIFTLTTVPSELP